MSEECIYLIPDENNVFHKVDVVEVNPDDVAEALEKAYQQGRADAEAEHKAMCESCIHKVSADDVKAIRNSAIDEIYELADEKMAEQIKYLEQNTRRNGKMWAKYMNTYLGHIKVACRQLKENKNG